MTMKTLKEIYNSKKKNEEMFLEQIIEQNFLTLNKLLENPDVVKQMANSISHLQEVASVMKKLTPSFSTYLDYVQTQFTDKKQFCEAVSELSTLTSFLSCSTFVDSNDVLSSFEANGGSKYLLSNNLLENTLKELNKLPSVKKQLVSEQINIIPSVLFDDEKNILKEEIKLFYHLNNKLFVNEVLGTAAAVGAGLYGGSKAFSAATHEQEINYDELLQAVTRIEAIIKRLGPPEMFKRVKAGIATLQDKLEAQVSKEDTLVNRALNWAGLGGDTKKLLGEAVLAVQMFTTLAARWPAIRKIMDRSLQELEKIAETENKFSDDDSNIQKDLGNTGVVKTAMSPTKIEMKIKNAVINILKNTGGTKTFFQKIQGMFSGKVGFSEGLSPEDFAQDIVDVIKDRTEREAKTIQETKTNKKLLSETLKDLDAIMNNFSKDAKEIVTLSNVVSKNVENASKQEQPPETQPATGREQTAQTLQTAVPAAAINANQPPVVPNASAPSAAPVAPSPAEAKPVIHPFGTPLPASSVQTAPVAPPAAKPAVTTPPPSVTTDDDEQVSVAPAQKSTGQIQPPSQVKKVMPKQEAEVPGKVAASSIPKTVVPKATPGKPARRT